MSHKPWIHRLSVFASACLLAGMVGGCSSVAIKKDVAKRSELIKKGPETAPHRSITGFSAALRCMDTLMIEYGVRDVSVLVEDIEDKTKKVNAGTKDMLISAVSDMTRRSRAVRLIAFGKDSGNAIAFLEQAESRLPYNIIPEYDIKGSVSQLDENIVRKQGDLGVSLQDPSLGAGFARDASANVLGLDLTVLSTDDFSVIPGVTSRNSVIIFKEGTGYDADASIQKFGINFSLSLSKSEGQAQALRSLVELAAVELIGKLTRTPYWTCLGVDGGKVEIENEMADWYYNLAANPQNYVAYFQNQLRLRGYYQGPSDGLYRPDIQNAIARYRTDLGVESASALDFALYKAHLNTRGLKVIPSLQAAPARALTVNVSSAGKARRLKRSEPFSLIVKPNRDAYVYCYLQDETRSIRRFYPNRFQDDPFVAAAEPLTLPGSMQFELVANDRGVKERVGCFATGQDVAQALPAHVIGTDFEALPVRSLEHVRAAFVRVTGNNVAEGYFDVDVR